MLVLVSLVHALVFALVLLKMTGSSDPIGFGLFILFLVALIPSLVVNLLVWIYGRWLVVAAANIAGAAAIFVYLPSVSAEAGATAPWAAIVFAGLGILLSACLIGWRRWTRRRRGA